MKIEVSIDPGLPHVCANLRINVQSSVHPDGHTIHFLSRLSDMSIIFRNDQTTPYSRLSSYPIASTDDADAAQSVVSRELTGSQIHKIRDRKNFRFEMNGVHFGDALVAWNRYESDIDLNSGLVDDTVGFIIGDQTPVFKMNDNAVACTRSTAALVSQSRMSVQRPAGSSIFVLKTTYTALERRYQEVTGRRPKGRILLRPNVGYF